MTVRPRALVIAYACEPGRGSEPGAGWGLVRALSEFADCVVLVGPAHSEGLANWKRSHPDAPLEFVTVPERAYPTPAWRGRIGWFVAYLRWLPAARRTALSLNASQAFDIAWHATYSVFWLPSPVHTLGIPSVWGPVGGAVTTPPSLRRLLGFRGALTDLLDRFVVMALSWLPSVRTIPRRASVVIVQNEATRERLPSPAAASAVVLNHALFVEVEGAPVTSVRRTRTLLLASSLESRKGVSLVLRAMMLVPVDVDLTIVGDGPERERLERFVQRSGLATRVHFLGQVPREILQALFNQSAAAVFTGLREEGGLALAEAMYGGAHVIVLDHGGAATIARFGTDQGRVTRVPVGSVDDTVCNLAAAMTRAVGTLSAERGPTIDRAAVRDTLHNAFTRALAAPTTRRVASPSNVPPAVTDSVTVVIPACNAERYLRSAAMSVLEQTHRTLTLVIVNDGSSDGTQDVAERIAASDPRVHVISTANRGRACARNTGVHAEPESDFIAFLDADDLWDRTKLAEQLHAMHARPDAAGVGSFMRYVSSSDRVLGETGQAITEVDARQIARGELAPFPISSCLLVRSKVFAEMTGFDEELREAEDLDFIARLARRGPILTIEHSLGAYRIHPDSAMARSRARVNMFARFVRRRFRERDAGRDLAWADFEASYRPSLRERRRDAVEIWYRSAALWRGEGRMMRAAGYAALAAIAAPAYTARRLLRQRVVVLG